MNPEGHSSVYCGCSGQDHTLICHGDVAYDYVQCLLLQVCLDNDVHVKFNCIHYSRMLVNGVSIPVACMHNRTLLCQPSVCAFTILLNMHVGSVYMDVSFRHTTLP